jgi:ribosomal protein S18 acetylase RimI-like enzyme
LAEAIQAGRSASIVGPFIASADLTDPNPYRNYAVPLQDADPEEKDIAGLIEWFVSRERKPRLEYLPQAAAALEAKLLAAGFKQEGLLPLMTLRAGDLEIVHLPERIEYLRPSTDEEFRAVAQTQNDAYGGGEATDSDVVRLRNNVQLSGEVLAAYDAVTGRVVGAGIYTPPYDGVTEIAAIGVLRPYRRRGIAAALTARLARTSQESGIAFPFLMAEGQAEQRIYERSGFELRTQILHISRPV